jgi:branched-chain amino acid transport system ATP-binding protein
VDFTLKPGQLKSIIGPNGAGKTTLFNLIAGVHRATGGKVFFRDRDITDLSLHQTSRLGITKTYQVTHIFPGLTVFENVRIAAQSRLTSFNFWRTIHSLSALNEKALGILEQVELLEKRSWLASTLSHGERRYLEIGIALATEPQVLLLDEPTAGMSVAETRQCAELIQKLNRDLHLSIVLVEHDMSVVMGISDEILVLNEGKVLAEGTPQQVSDNQEVQRVYLGEEKHA